MNKIYCAFIVCVHWILFRRSTGNGHLIAGQEGAILFPLQIKEQISSSPSGPSSPPQLITDLAFKTCQVPARGGGKSSYRFQLESPLFSFDSKPLDCPKLAKIYASDTVSILSKQWAVLPATGNCLSWKYWDHFNHLLVIASKGTNPPPGTHRNGRGFPLAMASS